MLVPFRRVIPSVRRVTKLALQLPAHNLATKFSPPLRCPDGVLRSRVRLERRAVSRWFAHGGAWSCDARHTPGRPSRARRRRRSGQSTTVPTEVWTLLVGLSVKFEAWANDFESVAPMYAEVARGTRGRTRVVGDACSCS